MDGISKQIIAIAGQPRLARLAQNVQAYVLRQAMDMQQSSMRILPQAATGPQPLAISGSLGTRLDVLA